MNKFHVVLWHNKQRIFSSIQYNSENSELTERDLLKIEDYYADKGGGVTKVTTVTVSWQILAEIPKGR